MLLQVCHNYGSSYVSQVKGYAYFINRRLVLDIIDIETGEKLDYIECPDRKMGFLGPYPTIYENKLYLVGYDNTLYRYPTYPWK